ncbi:MAG: 2Fe-2S iron-sulfur cluster-binding protein [Bacteroidia bacterium]
MSTYNITVTDSDGTVDTLIISPDTSSKRLNVERKETGTKISVDLKENLMHVLCDTDFDVPGACGGMAACGTCHLAILEGTVPNKMESDEEFMLEGLPNVQDNSRLACQIPVVAELGGLKVQVIGDM